MDHYRLKTSAFLGLISLLLQGGFCVRISEDGGYTDLVVALAPSTSEQTGNVILPLLQNLLNLTAYKLHVLTKGRFRLESISILVPNSWNHNFNYEVPVNSFETYQNADIRVDDPLYSFQNEPWTHHSRLCGQSGEFIHFTSKFLKDINSYNDSEKPAELLLKQWYVYRFGIKDKEEENNFTSSTTNKSTVQSCAYPLHYSIRNSKCLQRNTICSKETKSNNTKSSSRINTQTMPGCDDNDNPSDPLITLDDECKEERIWKLISNRAKFKRKILNNFVEPKIRTVAFNWSTFIFVFDPFIWNNHLNNLNIRNALGKFFVVDFPPDYNINLLMAEKQHDYYDLRERNLTKFIDIWNSISTEKDRDVFGAITKAVNILKTGSQPGIIILIHSGVNLTKDAEEINSAFLTANIKFHIVLYPSGNFTSSKNQEMIELMKRTKISWHLVPDTLINKYQCDLKGRARLEDELISIISLYEPIFYRSKYMIHQQLHNPLIFEDIFPLGYKGNTQTTVHWCSSNVNGSSLTVDGQEVSVLDKQVESTFQFTSGEFDLQEGQHNYSITFGQMSRLSLTSVWHNISSRSFEVKCIIDTTTTIKYKLHTLRPVIIRASINLNGSVPQGDFHVMATIVDSFKRQTTVQLWDLGNDPDMTKNDGIYSRYFVMFSDQPTFYYVTVRASDKLDVKIASFIATDSSSFFTDTTSKDAENFPPNLITDFHLDELIGNQAFFSWTAPGNCLDHEAADYYKLLCSNSKDSLENIDHYKILEKITPKRSGYKEHHQHNLHAVPDDTHYCAILTQSRNGLQSPRSNIITVHLQNSTDVSTPSLNITDGVATSTKVSLSGTTRFPDDEEIRMSQHILEMVILWICVAAMILLIIIHQVARSTFCPKDKEHPPLQRSEPNIYSAAPTARANGLSASQNLYGEPGEYIHLMQVPDETAGNEAAQPTEVPVDMEITSIETEESFVRQPLQNMTTFATPERTLRRVSASHDAAENAYDSVDIQSIDRYSRRRNSGDSGNFDDGLPLPPPPPTPLPPPPSTPLPSPPPTPQHHYAEIHEFATELEDNSQ